MPTTARAKPQDESLAVAEIEWRYPDEWVLLEITQEHKRHERIKGRLLAHSKHRDDLAEPYRRFRADHPRTQTYQFFTGDIVAPDQDFVVVL